MSYARATKSQLVVMSTKILLEYPIVGCCKSSYWVWDN